MPDRERGRRASGSNGAMPDPLEFESWSPDQRDDYFARASADYRGAAGQGASRTVQAPVPTAASKPRPSQTSARSRTFALSFGRSPTRSPASCARAALHLHRAHGRREDQFPRHPRPAIATGRGKDLIGRKVKKGRVAFATAENPDDLRMRLMVACFVFKIDPSDIARDIMISDNRVTPEAITEWIKASDETSP